jgi:RND family efflux transporter MFP subunit
MKKLHIYSVGLLIILASCGGKKTDLTAKKAELDKLKKEIAAMQTKASALEAEIAKIENKEEAGKLVETENVNQSVFNSYLTITGRADADQSTIATSQVPALVTAILVQPGASVAAGQALATLDNAALKQSRQQLEQQLAYVTTLYDKQKRLWEQGIGTEVQFLTIKNQKEAIEKNLATMDVQLGMYIVKSPISGTIESVDTKVGQAAAPGFPLFKVVNLGNLKVVADVAESYSGKITQGDLVEVEFTDINKKIESRVTFASRVIDPLNRTFRIEISIPGNNEIKPNMIAKLKIIDYTNKTAISIPTNCIQSNEDQQFVVLAVQNGSQITAKRQAIKTGHAGLDRIEVLEGIKEGDKVIVTGFQELNDGQVITISNEAAK